MLAAVYRIKDNFSDTVTKIRSSWAVDSPSHFAQRKKKATFDTASKISEPRLGEQYRAIADYTKEDKWDLNLKAGTEVEVIEKTESVNKDPVEESWVFAQHVDIVFYENDTPSVEGDSVFLYENDSSEQCPTCDYNNDGSVL